jgi:hypothetical protein
VSTRRFAHRAETFGLDTQDPWALDALRLLFHVPRVFEPLAQAWEERSPGILKALDRLVSDGFVQFQPAVILDARTGEASTKRGRPVARYRTTASGRRLARSAREDIRVLQDVFPRLTDPNAVAVVDLLWQFDVDDLHARIGVSAPAAVSRTTLPERTGRWWVRELATKGYLKELDVRVADRRELVPGHWRVTRELCRQMRAVLDAFPEPHGALRHEFRLQRAKFLSDIDPARIGIDGATDFDHDVAAQRVLARMLESPSTLVESSFRVEPRWMLTADSVRRPWVFDDEGAELVPYQPDAIFKETNNGSVRLNVIEYERYQSRRDAWSHIERCLGYLALRTYPFEPAVLRFVVDTEARLRSYAELIGAFVDYAESNPDRLPGNAIVLAATTVDRLLVPGDCMDDRRWHRIVLRDGRSQGLPFGGHCVLHDPASSPYDSYFGRGE